MIELAIVLTLGGLVLAGLLILALVGFVLKLTFGVLKWVLAPVAILVGLVLLVVLGPVLVAVALVCAVVALPVLALCGVSWAGACLL